MVNARMYTGCQKVSTVLAFTGRERGHNMAERWADNLPPQRSGTYDWDTITAQLRSKPGKWLLIREQGARSIHTAIKRDKIAALRDPKWTYHVATRNTNGKAADIWMSAERKREEK